MLSTGKLTTKEIANRACREILKNKNAISVYERVIQGDKTDAFPFAMTLMLIDEDGQLFHQEFRRNVRWKEIWSGGKPGVGKYLRDEKVNESYKYFEALDCDIKKNQDSCVKSNCNNEIFSQYLPRSEEKAIDGISEINSHLVQGHEHRYENPRLHGLLIAAGPGFDKNFNPIGSIYKKLSTKEIANRACRKILKNKNAISTYERVVQGDKTDAFPFSMTLMLIDESGRLSHQEFRRNVYWKQIWSGGKPGDGEHLGDEKVNKSYEYFAALACCNKNSCSYKSN